jgi:hypothetical protein
MANAPTEAMPSDPAGTGVDAATATHPTACTHGHADAGDEIFYGKEMTIDDGGREGERARYGRGRKGRVRRLLSSSSAVDGRAFQMKG